MIGLPARTVLVGHHSHAIPASENSHLKAARVVVVVVGTDRDTTSWEF